MKFKTIFHNKLTSSENKSTDVLRTIFRFTYIPELNYFSQDFLLVPFT